MGWAVFGNNNIMHVPLIAHGVKIAEMSNREQWSVETTSMNLQPPNPFCFKKTEEWPKWRRRFEQYRVATRLTGREEEQQVSTVLKMQRIFLILRESLWMTKRNDKVVEPFDNYFKVLKNVIFERAHFNKRNQLSNESAEQFITVIHRMAENCELGNMNNELICDRIVVGIRNESLSKHLQMEAELTLHKAKRLDSGKQSENNRRC